MTDDSPHYGPEPPTDFEAQYRRLLEATGCRTQNELAEVLGIRQSSVSDARRRGAIPSGWLMTLLEKKRIHPEWLRTGRGEKIFPPKCSQEQPCGRPACGACCRHRAAACGGMHG